MPRGRAGSVVVDRSDARRMRRPLRPVAGLRVGRLVVVGDAGWSTSSPSGKRHRLVRCRCDCGGRIVVALNSLVGATTGSARGTKSCGCLLRENGRRQGASSGPRVRTHGESHPATPEYRAYVGMLTRCYNSSSKQYPRYGGRGIRVCVRWRDSYTAFLQDLGRRPSSRYSLDRRDNSKGYTPRNCRWATLEQQNRNRGRYNRKFRLNGVTRTLAEWVSASALSYQCVYARLGKGWTLSRALVVPSGGG